MEKAVEREVWQRSKYACEYCQLPQSASRLQFHIEHIVARQHGGRTESSNLAIACPRCNLRKGPNLSGRDSETGNKVWLFNPRRHSWKRHFRWDGPYLVGRTAIGRATIAVLAINHPHAIGVRDELIGEGIFPPELA